MAAWTDAETFKLIELWDDESVQEDLKGCMKNSLVFSKISEQVQATGYHRTLIQCPIK